MLTRESGYRRTMTACFLGYIVQATICTLAPLLYARFQTEYQIPLGRISLMITLTFAIQLLVDLASSFFVDRIGYRRCIVAAHFLAMAGFLLMAFLPDLTADPYTGLLIATLLYSAGAGLIEVLVSPIIDACPTERKSAAMNLLHSFFSWGQVAVVLLSTLFFRLFGLVLPNAPEGFSLPKPRDIDAAYAVADTLSQGFPFVRVDLYLTEKGVRFGEMTFTPAAALDNKRLPETDLMFGAMMEV